MHTRIEKLEGLRPPGEDHYPERIYLRGMDWSEAAGVVPEAQPPLVMVCAERAGFFREMTEAELIEWKHEYDSPE